MTLFLLLLLILVFIYKFYTIYKKYEPFDGNCIKEFTPTFENADGNTLYNGLKSLYNNSDISSYEISDQILQWKENDLSYTKVEKDLTTFMVDPTTKNYEYYDSINCKLTYLDI
jgi:hypothetical protein